MARRAVEGREKKWYARVLESLCAPIEAPLASANRRRRSASPLTSYHATTRTTPSTPSENSEDESSASEKVDEQPELVHDDEPSTSQAVSIQPACACCFIPRSRRRTKPTDDARLHANGELPQMRQQRTRTEHEHLRMIILQSVKKPEQEEPSRRNILAALPPLLANGGMRRGDISVISESEKIALSQLTSEQIADKFTRATLPVRPMVPWSGDLLRHWCATGYVDADLLTALSAASPRHVRRLQVRLCNEPYQILCRRPATSSYGCVYVVRRQYPTGDAKQPLLAAKVEQRKEHSVHRLQDELLAYQLLHPPISQPEAVLLGIVQPRFCVQRRAMLLPMLGPSLDEILHTQRQTRGTRQTAFSLRTVALIAAQTRAPAQEKISITLQLCRLEHVHSCGLVHRDVKPANLLFGQGFYRNLIDFGLARRWRLTMCGVHEGGATPVLMGQLPRSASGRSLDDTVAEKKALEQHRPVAGSARFASINAHNGYELSRRDDLESLGYVIAYLLRNGNLPWQGLDSGRHDKTQRLAKIAAKKRATSIEQLYKGQPHEFVAYMTYVRSLGFVDKPDYNYLRSLMRAVIDKHPGDAFEWVLPSAEKPLSPSRAVTIYQNV